MINISINLCMLWVNEDNCFPDIGLKVRSIFVFQREFLLLLFQILLLFSRVAFVGCYKVLDWNGSLVQSQVCLNLERLLPNRRFLFDIVLHNHFFLFELVFEQFANTIPVPGIKLGRFIDWQLLDIEVVLLG